MFLTSETPSGNWWASLDLSNDSSRTWSVLFVNGLFMGWAVLVVLLRVFTKCFMATRLFVDDFLMIGAVLFFTTFCVLNICAASLGFGRHIWNLPGLAAGADDSAAWSAEAISAAVARVQKINYTALAVLAPAIVLAKLSVLAILLRIFPPAMRALRLFLLGLSVVIVGCCTTQALIIVFQCFPVEASWGIDGGGEACYIKNLDAVVMGLGVLNVLIDLVICFAPIPYFLKLKLPRLQKLCLCALFLTGLIACGISVVRVLSLRGLNNDLDVTYATVPYLNWSCAEVGIIIIAGSVPSLRPLLTTILPDFLRGHNMTSFFNAGSGSSEHHKRGTSGTYKLSDVDETWKSSNTSTSGTGLGIITITKEYQIEQQPKPENTTRHGRSQVYTSPLTPGFAPRAIVTCERVKSMS